MDILQIVQLALQQSPVAALALFAIWLLKRSYEERIAEIQRRQEEEREDKRMLAELLQEINRSLGENTAVLREVKRLLAQDRPSSRTFR